ncbi:MAG: hypothetical protein RLZZ197_855 [Bacteroidota bacterium]
MRGIVIYCFIVFSLLLKDGSLEEDGSEDLFTATLPEVITSVLVNYSVQEMLDQYKASPLQVLLEQVSPPPRMA